MGLTNTSVSEERVARHVALWRSIEQLEPMLEDLRCLLDRIRGHNSECFGDPEPLSPSLDGLLDNGADIVSGRVNEARRLIALINSALF